MDNYQILIDNYIERLSKTVVSIRKLYNDLNEAANNKEKYEELEEYLKIALEVEDNLFKEIENTVIDSELFFNRLYYLIGRSEIEDSNEIAERIALYISRKTYLNPFLATEYDSDDLKEDNKISIDNQININYLINLIIEIDNILENTTNKDIRTKLTIAKNDILYKDKLVGKLIKNKEKIPQNTRQLCLDLKQNEDDVTYQYVNLAVRVFNSCYLDILTMKDSLLKQLCLKSALYPLTAKEVQAIAIQYFNSMIKPDFACLTANNPNNQIIINILNEAIEKKSAQKELIKKNSN